MPLAALSRWPWWRRWFGSRSERAAAAHLRRLGYRVALHNYTCPGGEIDLVALDGRTLVFVEVRSTASGDLERTAASVNAEKQRRVTHAALHFLNERHLFRAACRFDVLILSWPPGRREPVVEHIPHAFEAVGRFQMDC
jgi:putative endonuclease